MTNLRRAAASVFGLAEIEYQMRLKYLSHHICPEVELTIVNYKELYDKLVQKLTDLGVLTEGNKIADEHAYKYTELLKVYRELDGLLKKPAPSSSNDSEDTEDNNTKAKISYYKAQVG